MRYIPQSQGHTMSTNPVIAVLEEMLLGNPSESSEHKYSIFLTGRKGEESLPPEYLIELLLLYDSGAFDVETISLLFEVSVQDIVVFTEDYSGFGEMWEDSIATMWTAELQFYEEDLEKLAWVAKDAMKRAEIAVSARQSILEVTQGMTRELDDDDGWTDKTAFMRVEGLIARRTRCTILKDWFNRAGEDYVEYTST